MKLRMVGAEAFRSIRASMSTTVAATMTVLIGMFLLGLFIALGTYVLSWSDHVKSELVVKVFFDRDVKPAQVEAVRVKLDSNQQVRRFELVTAEQGLEKIKKQRPELFGADGLPFNPLGPAYTITPIKAEYTEPIANSLRPMPAGVHRVTYGKKTAEKILSVAKVIESIFLIAVLVLLSASTILIANTIRLSIFARRREIEVMKLVGATNWFVRGPFMLEGLIVGFIGSVCAVVLLLLGKEIALPQILGHIDDGDDVQAISFGLNALIVVGIGLLLGAAGSGLTIRRFLRV